MNTILLIDDEINLLQAYSLMLKRRGFRVLQANSAAEGIKILSYEDVDLIISDIYMPNKNGLVLVKQIKRMLRYRNVPIILLSAVGTRENVFRGIEMGVFSFLTKPCTFDKLLETVKEALQTSECSPKLPPSTIKDDYSFDVSIFLVYKSACITDYLNEFLAERFYKVYVNENIDKIDGIISEKDNKILIAEVNSISDKNFDYIYQIYTKNRYIGMPIIVFSEKAKELETIFESMDFQVDMILPKPFIFEDLFEEICTATNRNNIRRKLLLTLKKIKLELKGLYKKESSTVDSLKNEIIKIKNENSTLLQSAQKNKSNNRIVLILENNRKIDKLTREVSEVTKTSLIEKAELLESMKIVQYKIFSKKKSLEFFHN